MSYAVCWVLTNWLNSVLEHASPNSFASATSTAWVFLLRTRRSSTDGSASSLASVVKQLDGLRCRRNRAGRSRAGRSR